MPVTPRPTKMKIESFNNPAYSGSPISTYTLMFNPEKYEEQYTLVFTAQRSFNNRRSAVVFREEKLNDFTLDFTLDGTGAGAAAAGRGTTPVDVTKELESFYKTVKNPLPFKFDKGTYTRMPYCRLSWGPHIYKGMLKSARTTVTLLTPDGKPLRVKVQAIFTGDPLA